MDTTGGGNLEQAPKPLLDLCYGPIISFLPLFTNVLEEEFRELRQYDVLGYSEANHTAVRSYRQDHC